MSVYTPSPPKPENVPERFWRKLSPHQKTIVVEHERMHELCNKTPNNLKVPTHLLSDIINTDLD